MHKPESDINTAKREMEMYALTLLLNALAFFFFQDLKKGSKRRRNGRLGQKMQAVRRVTGVGVSPCG